MEVLISFCVMAFMILAVASMRIASLQENGSADNISDTAAWAADADHMENLNRIVTLKYQDGDHLKDENGYGGSGLANMGLPSDYGTSQECRSLNWNISENSLIPNTKTWDVLVALEEKGVLTKHLQP
ncbi:MAG: hypothetical protein JW932_12850 [Deltaproteobacteria bacterium]|nr:hypothetical protein [Deltaproteobacteria bacterium]